MKKIKLKENKVVSFDAQNHIYSLADGTQLSGITSIIHKYLFPSMYSGVNTAIMDAARERGHNIHSELELEFRCPELNDGTQTPEILSYRELMKEYQFVQIAAEYLVSDNKHIATSIDCIIQTDAKSVALVDYKTTSVLYEEYLQWQLSIEADLFEAQTGKKVSNLYAIHLPKGGAAKLVEISRIPSEHINALLDAFINNDGEFKNPLHVLSDDTHELLKQYKEAEIALIELKASLRYYEQIQIDIKARIKEQMESEKAFKWEDDGVSITRSKDTTRRTFKVDIMKEKASEEVKKWLDSNLDSCYAESKVLGSLTIKFK